VVLLRGEDDATAYRTPTDGRVNILRPELVCWSYQGSALWTIRRRLRTHDRPFAGMKIVIYCCDDGSI
jgi:hypothetical protein